MAASHKCRLLADAYGINKLLADAKANEETSIVIAGGGSGFALAVFYFVFVSKRYAGKVSVQRDIQGFY